MNTRNESESRAVSFCMPARRDLSAGRSQSHPEYFLSAIRPALAIFSRSFIGQPGGIIFLIESPQEQDALLDNNIWMAAVNPPLTSLKVRSFRRAIALH